MAKNTASPPTQPPPSSSSWTSDEISSDEEQTSNAKPNPQQAPTKNEEESESESEEEESPDEDDDEKFQRSNSTASKLQPEPEKIVTPSKPISEKSNGKSPFQRLWSLGDEIAILEAMVDHQSKNGPIKISVAGVKDFHDSIRKSLSINVGTTKLAEKMRKMRKKYIDADRRGDGRKFANAHDLTCYELGKKVWGMDTEREDGLVEKAFDDDSNGATVNKGKSLKREFPFIRDALGGNKLALEMLQHVDVNEAMVLERKFKKLKFAEINLLSMVYKVLCDEAGEVMN